MIGLKQFASLSRLPLRCRKFPKSLCKLPQTSLRARHLLTLQSWLRKQTEQRNAVWRAALPFQNNKPLRRLFCRRCFLCPWQASLHRGEPAAGRCRRRTRPSVAAAAGIGSPPVRRSPMTDDTGSLYAETPRFLAGNTPVMAQYAPKNVHGQKPKQPPARADARAVKNWFAGRGALWLTPSVTPRASFPVGSPCRTCTVL